VSLRIIFWTVLIVKYWPIPKNNLEISEQQIRLCLQKGKLKSFWQIGINENSIILANIMAKITIVKYYHSTISISILA
jgi:hypothetical protein